MILTPQQVRGDKTKGAIPLSSYKHILLASNLSKESDHVADKALMVAQQANAKLSIVHVVEFSPMMYGGGEFAIPLDGDIETSIQNKAKKELKRQAARLHIAAENQYIESGSTAEWLINLVNTIKADLLIVGCHEQHGFGILLGSTANTLLHTMPCDVLAIRV